MTPDQRILLEDKLTLWREGTHTGPMDLRDYNRRCADALEAALSPPSLGMEGVRERVEAILREHVGKQMHSRTGTPLTWNVTAISNPLLELIASISTPGKGEGT